VAERERRLCSLSLCRNAIFLFGDIVRLSPCRNASLLFGRRQRPPPPSPMPKGRVGGGGVCSPETIGVAPAAEGLEMVGGDFFKSSTVPKGDIYMMKVRVRGSVCVSVCVGKMFVTVALCNASHRSRVNSGHLLAISHCKVRFGEPLRNANGRATGRQACGSFGQPRGSVFVRVRSLPTPQLSVHHQETVARD
jgi:hypothetical protein